MLMNLKFDKTDYTIVKILMNGIGVEKSIESFLNVEQRIGSTNNRFHVSTSTEFSLLTLCFFSILQKKIYFQVYNN